MELVAVVALVAIVAVFAVSRVATLARKAKITAANADIATIKRAISSSEMCLVNDLSGIPGFYPSELRIANLLIATNLYVLAQYDGKYPTARSIHSPIVANSGIATNMAEFTTWDEMRQRGWRGPYIECARGVFPSKDYTRFADDAPSSSRGFFPDVSSLYIADDLKDNDASVYGFPGEAAIIDPWGNPYVLQVPPPQAFTNGVVHQVSPALRWKYARIVSAGEDGRLDTPCYFPNNTNSTASTWNTTARLLSRQAGLASDGNLAARGDDIVLFINRADIDEAEE